MKFLLLTAAAVIATPLVAQTTPPADPAMQTAPATDPAAQTQPAADPAQTPPMDPSAQTAPAAPADSSMPATMPAPTTGSGGESAGGYQPAGPATNGTPAPGATVRFQQAPDPATAFPPPAPMDKYPMCKKGQTDHCMQRGGR